MPEKGVNQTRPENWFMPSSAKHNATRPEDLMMQMSDVIIDDRLETLFEDLEKSVNESEQREFHYHIEEVPYELKPLVEVMDKINSVENIEDEVILFSGLALQILTYCMRREEGNDDFQFEVNDIDVVTTTANFNRLEKGFDELTRKKLTYKESKKTFETLVGKIAVSGGRSVEIDAWAWKDDPETLIGKKILNQPVRVRLGNLEVSVMHPQDLHCFYKELRSLNKKGEIDDPKTSRRAEKAMMARFMASRYRLGGSGLNRGPRGQSG